MAESDSLEALQGLQRDLLALSASQLPTVERLWAELESQLEHFRKLLDKARKNDGSRRTLISGTIQLNDASYSVNDEFKQEAIQIADQLDLDELKAAQLLLIAQSESQGLDRPAQASAIIRFHSERHFRLECFRLTLELSINEDLDEDLHEGLKTYIRRCLNIENGPPSNGSDFFRRTLNNMEDCERWLQNLASQVLRARESLQNPSQELLEILEFQTKSLNEQHESLAAIATYMVKSDITGATDLKFFLEKACKMQRHDIITVHYLPIGMSLIAQLGSSDNKCNLGDARNLHTFLRDAEKWSLRPFHATILACWLGEYSGRYIEDPRGSPVQGADLSKEADERAQLFADALKDGAFHFLLSVCQEIRRNDWYEPAKVDLISLLLQDTPVLPSEGPQVADFFRHIITTEIQLFVESFIMNMPDSLRKLKVEEDEKRRNIHFQIPGAPPQYEMHLERFLVIISLGYEGHPDAAATFWEDPDGNLFGFLQWAAKRQTTPRVAAFCEMLRSIAEDEKCADAAHLFMIDEGASTSGRLRRTGSLGWSQIFAELQFYAEKARDKPAAAQTNTFQASNPFGDTDTEPESFIMLECYLRLAAHILKRSARARDWILNNPNFSLHEVLLRLCENDVSSEVRAGAFSTLTALLEDKEPGLDAYLWEALDNWVHHVNFKTGAMGIPSVPNVTPARSEELVFETIATTFNESNAFVKLLNALISPSAQVELDDMLPFPENLGSNYRAPGIDAFVDFTAYRIFAVRAPETNHVQERILKLNCLTFLATCLSTFNEDLVVIANQTNFPVESSLRTSSLIAYVRLHPFARVMEWLFNDKVVKSLFSALDADVDEIGRGASDSPLVLLVIRSIEVISLIMKLQGTYLNFVRPLVKKHSPNWKEPVANPALASFEDAILTRLEIVTNLGLYCGTGHQELTTVSLNLLEKLSSSRKLVVSPNSGFGQRSDRSKIISIFEKNDEHERIAQSFISDLQLDSRELELGPDAPGYVTKIGILRFLNSCLAALPNRPTVAHLLLGFKCTNNGLDISPDGAFACGDALFHAVLQLAVEFPTQVDGSYIAWLSNVKQLATEILQKLWISPISAPIVLTELRGAEYIAPQALKLVPVDSVTFEDAQALDANFLVSDSAVSFRNLIEERQAFFDYAARELRSVAKEGLPTFTARVQSVLSGITTRPDGVQVRNLTIFDLFDFADYDISQTLKVPDLTMLGELDFDICQKTGPNSVTVYDLENAAELLALRRNEVLNAAQAGPNAVLDQNVLQCIETDTQSMLVYLHGVNQIAQLRHAHDKALEAWVRVMIVLAEIGEFHDSSAKVAFILQAVQIILPKLERSFNDNTLAAQNLVRFSRTLLLVLDFKDPSLQTGRPGDVSSDRLFQLFRVILTGSFSVVSDVELREICYQVCFRYLQGMASTSGSSSTFAKSSIKTLKVAGDRFIDMLCDDAYSGRGTCKISALLLLNALVALNHLDESNYMLESFNRLNFIGLIVDSVKHIPVELRETSAADIPLLLDSYKATLSLLLRISQSRKGAAQVASAGLFAAARDSQLFSADPDIGIEFENPTALLKFYDLMLAVLRVINAVVLSRGQQNERTIPESRQFLTENRTSVVSIFKRNAGIGVRATGPEAEILNELVDQFTLLMSITDFVEYEDKDVKKGARKGLFS